MGRTSSEKTEGMPPEKRTAAQTAENAPATGGEEEKKTGGKGTRSETVPSSAAQKKEALAENDGEVEALKETVAKLQEQLQAALSAKAAQPAQVIQVVTPDSEKVTMRFQADVADDNVAVFGPSGLYGQVTGKMGTVVVPKAEWSRFYTDSVRRMIDR